MKNPFKIKQGGLTGAKMRSALKTKIVMFVFALSAIAMSGVIVAQNIDKVDALSCITSTPGIAIATVGLVWIKEDKSFKKLTPEEVDKLSEEHFNLYSKALSDFTDKRDAEIAKRIGELDLQNEEHKKELGQLKAELNGISLADIRELLKVSNVHAKAIREMQEKGGISKDTMISRIKAAYDTNLEALKTGATKSGRSTVEMHIQKIANYGDIDSGLDFAQMRTGVTDIPVRAPRIRSLFRSLPVQTEFYKYTEQLTVVRDAQNVASQTSPATKNTKETLKVNNIQTQIIKDIIPFCRDFVGDYPFMMSRIDMLLNSSISLKVDYDLLNGTGVAPQIFSLNSTSSEFSAANVVANVALKIKDASYIDLILAMKLQVDMLGKLGSYDADTVLVNKVDWFLYAESRKDANNNYLDSRITYINGVPFVGGMRVVWLTTDLLVQNKLFVFDSSKGEIVDRQLLVIEVSYENNDNWEKEIAELKGYERLNFLVPNNDKNAFMKCSDVATAITAIKIP